MLTEAIPEEPPRVGGQAMLVRLQGSLFHLTALLNAISLTVAHGFMTRCMDVVRCHVRVQQGMAGDCRKD